MKPVRIRLTLLNNGSYGGLHHPGRWAGWTVQRTQPDLTVVRFHSPRRGEIFDQITLRDLLPEWTERFDGFDCPDGIWVEATLPVVGSLFAV